MKVRNFFNRSNGKGQYFTQKSMTVPDQSMSIKDLLKNYAKGLPLGGYDPNAAIWDDESDGIHPRKLDLVDLQELKEGNRIQIEELQAEIRKPKQQVNEVNVGGDINT